MRTGPTFFQVSHVTTAEATTTAKATFSPPATIQRSPWHSPVPYLFGGLAAMLGLIAFALLILACSYWKLSGQSNGGDETSDRDADAAEKGEGGSYPKALPVFEEKFLVIMAGNIKPTFLATPSMSTSRSSSFNDENKNISDTNNKLGKEKEEKIKKLDQTNVENIQTSTSTLPSSSEGHAQSQVSQE